MALSSSKKVRVEKYPLPGDIDGILSLVREVLSAGSVQRIELDVSKPMRVLREVETGEDPDLMEPDLDYDSALRNIDMLEYASDGASSYQIVVDMMQLIHSEGLHSITWVAGTGGEGLLTQWFEFKERGMPLFRDHSTLTGMTKLLGLPLRRLKSLPEETLILCGSQFPGADPSELSLAVKTTIEMRRPDESQSDTGSQSNDNDPVWPNPTERTSATSKLALTAGDLRSTGWRPDD